MENKARIHTLTLPSAMLKRGFWLYVWRITTKDGECVHYVGRTGDASSPNAAPPYARMGQHLARNRKGHLAIAAQLGKSLEKKDIVPEECKQFELTAYGPILPECKHSGGRVADMEKHKIPRDKMAALEKKLADAMQEAGYKVINTIKSRMPLDQHLWQKVNCAFTKHFSKLKN